MSSRLTRALLGLYPRRVRDRYGDELLDLEDELWERGELSRRRLIRDMLVGALVIQPTRRRSRLLTGAVLVVVALAVAGSVIGGQGTEAPAGHPASRLLATVEVHTAPQAPTLPSTGGDTCPVAAGSPCSDTPCTEFIAQSTVSAAARGVVTAARRRARPAGSRCDAYPRAVGHTTLVTARPGEPTRIRRR